MKTIIKRIVSTYTSGIVLKSYEVKKYKTPGFCISNFYLKRVGIHKNVMLFSNSDLSYSRFILLNKYEISKISFLLKSKSNRFNINYIFCVRGIVKLSFSIVSLQVRQLVLKDLN
ncbi:hypothetical protein [Candidatus Vidania fulgoroideorum]